MLNCNTNCWWCYILYRKHNDADPMTHYYYHESEMLEREIWSTLESLNTLYSTLLSFSYKRLTEMNVRIVGTICRGHCRYSAGRPFKMEFLKIDWYINTRFLKRAKKYIQISTTFFLTTPMAHIDFPEIFWILNRYMNIIVRFKTKKCSRCMHNRTVQLMRQRKKKINFKSHTALFRSLLKTKYTGQRLRISSIKEMFAYWIHK